MVQHSLIAGSSVVGSYVRQTVNPIASLLTGTFCLASAPPPPDEHRTAVPDEPGRAGPSTKRARLTEALQAARRLEMIAGRRLTRARAGRDETAVAAAAVELQQARHRADVLSQCLAAAGQQQAEDLVHLAEEVLDQAGRVFDAGLAATGDLLGFPPADRRDTAAEG
jgi:hypothetical protein